MSVLIKDMEKPKYCYAVIDGMSEYCPFINKDDDCVLLLIKGICRVTWEEQYSKCPLVETPEPCEDAVSRKDVQSITERSDWFESSDSFNDFLWALYALPPVTPKRKTGKWNFIGDQMFECTECGTCYTQNQFHQMMVRITDPEFPNFCPNCGADMGGKQDG